MNYLKVLAIGVMQSELEIHKLYTNTIFLRE